MASYTGSDGWRYYDPTPKPTIQWTKAAAVAEDRGLPVSQTAHERLYKALRKALRSNLWTDPLPGQYDHDMSGETFNLESQVDKLRNDAFDTINLIEDMISEIADSVSDV
jgi:hypothetical protein